MQSSIIAIEPFAALNYYAISLEIIPIRPLPIITGITPTLNLKMLTNAIVDKPMANTSIEPLNPFG